MRPYLYSLLLGPFLLFHLRQFSPLVLPKCAEELHVHFRIYLAKAPKKPLALARVRCVAFAQKNKTKDFDCMNRWLRAKYQSNGTHVADWIILPRA